MPVPTPWIRTYDTPELYIGGYKSGVAAGEVNQRGQIAGMEAANRLQIAQMEVAARQDIANKQLLAEEHRHAIEDQYKQTQFGLQRQQLELQTKMDQQKLDQAARQASTMMEFQKRYKAGEDYTKLAQELGPMMGEGFYKPPVTRPTREYPSPYVAAKARVIENTLTELNKARAIADKKHIPEIDEQIAIANKQLEDLFNPTAKKASTAGRYVRNPDGSLRFEPPEPASLGEALRQPSLIPSDRITMPGGLSMSASPAEAQADVPPGLGLGRVSIGAPLTLPPPPQSRIATPWLQLTP